MLKESPYSILTEVPKANKKQINCNNQQLVDDNTKRIAKLEARYKEDDKFTITRAKIINFLEENNIE